MHDLSQEEEGRYLHFDRCRRREDRQLGVRLEPSGGGGDLDDSLPPALRPGLLSLDLERDGSLARDPPLDGQAFDALAGCIEGQNREGLLLTDADGRLVGLDPERSKGNAADLDGGGRPEPSDLGDDRRFARRNARHPAVDDHRDFVVLAAPLNREGFPVGRAPSIQGSQYENRGFACRELDLGRLNLDLRRPFGTSRTRFVARAAGNEASECGGQRQRNRETNAAHHKSDSEGESGYPIGYCLGHKFNVLDDVVVDDVAD